jgi:hypothetical protein
MVDQTVWQMDRLISQPSLELYAWILQLKCRVPFLLVCMLTSLQGLVPLWKSWSPKPLRKHRRQPPIKCPEMLLSAAAVGSVVTVLGCHQCKSNSAGQEGFQQALRDPCQHKQRWRVWTTRPEGPRQPGHQHHPSGVLHRFNDTWLGVTNTI